MLAIYRRYFERKVRTSVRRRILGLDLSRIKFEGRLYHEYPIQIQAKHNRRMLLKLMSQYTGDIFFLFSSSGIFVSIFNLNESLET